MAIYTLMFQINGKRYKYQTTNKRKAFYFFKKVKKHDGMLACFNADEWGL